MNVDATGPGRQTSFWSKLLVDIGTLAILQNQNVITSPNLIKALLKASRTGKYSVKHENNLMKHKCSLVYDLCPEKAWSEIVERAEIIWVPSRHLVK